MSLPLLVELPPTKTCPKGGRAVFVSAPCEFTPDDVVGPVGTVTIVMSTADTESYGYRLVAGTPLRFDLVRLRRDDFGGSRPTDLDTPDRPGRVSVDVDTPRCSCKGFKYTGGCKHLATFRAAAAGTDATPG